MFITILVCGLVLIVSLIVFSHWCCYRAGRDKGYDEARIERAAERKAERDAERKGRHARTEPHTAPSENQRVQDLGRITWNRDDAVGSPVTLPTLAANLNRMRTSTDVILPEPGTYPPAPARSTAPGTVTFPRVELKDATTGEIRAIGDANVAAIHEAGATT